MSTRIAVLLPCYNEGATIGAVIDDVRAACPAAEVVVFDNNSSDRSAAIAAEKNVRVVRVSRQGKGNVVRAMLKKVDADVFVMLDADATYPADRIPDVLKPVLDGTSDMVVGARLGSPEVGAFRRFHHTGNLVLCRLISLIWGARLTDVLSGYRAFCRGRAHPARRVQRLRVRDRDDRAGALLQHDDLGGRHRIRARPEGSFAKLRSYRNGFAIGLQVFHLLRAYKPLTFFGGVGLVCLGTALILGLSTSVDLSQPAGVLAATLILLGALLIGTGSSFNALTSA